MKGLFTLILLVALVTVASAWTIGVQATSISSMPGVATWSWNSGNTCIGLSGAITFNDNDGVQTKAGFAELGWRQYKPGAFLYPFYGAAVGVEYEQGSPRKYIPSTIFGMAHDLRKDLVLEFETRPLSATYQDKNLSITTSNIPGVAIGLTYLF
jgi:hypothetical protein